MKQSEYSYIYESDRNIIYPIYEDREICPKVIETLGYNLNKIVNKSLNEVSVIHTLGKYPFDSITFIGLGNSQKMNTLKMRKAFEKVSQVIKEPSNFDAKRAVTDDICIHKVTKLFMETYILTSYQEHKVLHDQKEIIDVNVLAPDINVQEDIDEALAYAYGINHARALSDMPSNYMTPVRFVKEAEELAQKYGMECTILDKELLEKMNAGGILAVNQGSHIPAYMICLKYTNAETPYSAVVGKGLCFDSGGYNIKNNSLGMKYDMCGGADVLGIMEVLASTKAKVNVYGIIPTTENLVSGEAYKPQDVITTLSKKTVEIISTDAEGRLILCDALTYAQQLKATRIIDLATLTGACVRALGSTYTGVFSNSDAFYALFEEAMKESDEKGWRLPMDQEYLELLQSRSADLKNSAGKPIAGASVAANFLNEFIDENVEWIHLDIAGTADNNGTSATGAMIRSVVNVLKK